jgi:hypothetical protein
VKEDYSHIPTRSDKSEPRTEESKTRLATEDDLRRIYGSGSLLIGSIFRPAERPTPTPKSYTSKPNQAHEPPAKERP